MKQEIEKKEVIIRKELEVKMVLCNNENILNDYKLELSKKMKNTSELKELLIKKERIELQKQLLELVPMVEKFNLIAKEMNKDVECGLSVEYQYIGDGEVLEVLKSSSYKNKMKITIHVFNRAERRSYIWNLNVFKHRFELAISMFEIFIRTPKDPQVHPDLRSFSTGKSTPIGTRLPLFCWAQPSCPSRPSSTSWTSRAKCLLSKRGKRLEKCWSRFIQPTLWENGISQKKQLKGSSYSILTI